MRGIGARAIEYIAGKLGYTIIPTWRLDRYEQAQYLTKLLHLLEIDCVLDVGANLGQYRDFLRNEVGYRGTIVSYEPIPDHVAVLHDRARGDESWFIEGYALGRECTTANFNVMSSTTFSSFLSPDHENVKRFGDANVVRQCITVDVLTLDESISRLSNRLVPRNIYMKLDTQGFDIEVAKGAERVLGRVLALQTEVSFKQIYRGMPDYATSIRTFAELGFEVSGLFRNNEGHFPELFEMDCHMIAKKVVSR